MLDLADMLAQVQAASNAVNNTANNANPSAWADVLVNGNLCITVSISIELWTGQVLSFHFTILPFHFRDLFPNDFPHPLLYWREKSNCYYLRLIYSWVFSVRCQMQGCMNLLIFAYVTFIQYKRRVLCLHEYTHGLPHITDWSGDWDTDWWPKLGYSGRSKWSTQRWTKGRRILKQSHIQETLNFSKLAANSTRSTRRY